MRIAKWICWHITGMVVWCQEKCGNVVSNARKIPRLVKWICWFGVKKNVAVFSNAKKILSKIFRHWLPDIHNKQPSLGSVLGYFKMSVMVENIYYGISTLILDIYKKQHFLDSILGHFI